MLNQLIGRQHSSAWYVVHTRPHKEEQVAQALHEYLGVGVYVPLVRQRYRAKLEASPFFPCYLFVRADLARIAMSAINTTPGVVRLISCGDAPLCIDDELVAELRRRVDELNEHGGMLDTRLYPGVAVRLRSGPLRGLEGAFVGPTSPSSRVRVFIDFMGSLRETVVPAAAVEPIGDIARLPGQRRTRGKGRRIAK